MRYMNDHNILFVYCIAYVGRLSACYVIIFIMIIKECCLQFSVLACIAFQFMMAPKTRPLATVSKNVPFISEFSVT